MQKALVLGATGFFGRHFIKKAAAEMEVTALNSKSCDLLTDKLYDFNQAKYDYIFHFAVKTEAGGYCQRHPGEQFLINERMNATVLNYWKELQPQAKFVTFGSSCSYSDDALRIEDNYLLGSCESGYEVYGMVKRMLLVGLKALAEEFGMKYMFFVPSCLYGPDYDQKDKHFIYDLVRKICDAKYKKVEPVVLWGTGFQRRELIFIDDAVDIILKSLNQENEVINLSTGNDCSIREYAELICDIVDYEFDQIKFDTSQYVGAEAKKFEVDKIKDYPFAGPEMGLQSVVKYYIDKYMEKECQ